PCRRGTPSEMLENIRVRRSGIFTFSANSRILQSLREKVALARRNTFGGEMIMRVELIETAHSGEELDPSPIEPAWVIEGDPQARSRLLSTSACGTAKTIIWSCTEGKFNWYYDLDETIMILEGTIVLQSESAPPKRYCAGDVIYFRKGAHAKWHV